MYPTTGYTPVISRDTRIANLAAQLDILAVMAAAARSEGDPERFERIMTGYALAALNQEADQPADFRTAMELRSNVISAALKDSDWMGEEQRESLWQEFDEIQAWLQKDDQPELGSRVTIRCGEVVELDQPAASKFDPDEVYPF
jgi:hypothetical protein